MNKVDSDSEGTEDDVVEEFEDAAAATKEMLRSKIVTR